VSVQRAVARVIEEAIAAGRVLHIDYVDRHGALSRRAIEPVGFVPHRDQWFLLAWCRSRGAARTFRLDRVVRAVATGETATVDEPAECLALSLDIPEASLVRLTLP
jgi:predicted DNA-binding transcriptional regulator YafY